MAALQRRTRHNPKTPSQPTSRPLAHWDGLPNRTATTLALLLIVARPLFPSEDADTGTGLVFVALWGLVAVLWAAGQAMRGGLWCYATWLDLGPIVLLAVVICSTVRADTLRPAINVVSEWGGLVLCYLSMRQLFRSAAAQRLVICAMLGVAVALAAYGIYQVFWGFESVRAEYARDRIAILRDLQVAPGSPQEEAFKNRLNSHEPFATFALANSLAGFLLAWLPIALACWFHRFLQGTPANGTAGNRAADRLNAVKHFALGALVVLIIFLCLVLTQSRTAYVGMCIQLVLLGVLFGRTLMTRLRSFIGTARLAAAGLGLAAVIATVILVAWRRGKLDEMLFTQAAKSFNYRLQYWQATVRLIADRPWTGTGPGNFRGHYLRYKLPESSEEIADPHNMVLELVATSGWVAGGVLAGTLVASVSFMFLRPRELSAGAGSHGLVELLLGGLGGFALAAALSGFNQWIHISLFGIWCLTSVSLWRLTLVPIDSRLIAISVTGLAIHLLGAGGISMAGVSQSLWALLAIGLNVSEGSAKSHELRGPIWCRGILLGTVAGWVSFVALVVRPVALSMATLSAGRNLRDVRDLGGAEAKFRLAADQDPLAAEPWLELSRIHYERWLSGRGRSADEQFGHAVAALEHAQRLAPSRVEPVLSLAQLYEVQAEGDSKFWDKTARMYEKCVELYPNNARYCVRLARAHWQAGQPEVAKAVAARAIQLDSETTHSDRKLTPAEHRLLEPLQHH